MGMTITEKIICRHAGLKHVEPGQFVMARPDILLANDITAPLAIKEFRQARVTKVHDPKKVVFVLDHFTPNRDIRSAENCREIREFSRQYGIRGIYEGPRGGIEHALLPEQGIVTCGDLVIGADSHTCTYGGLAAFATGVGSTDFASALWSGEVWLKVPPTIRCVFFGARKPWVYGKDLILKVIADLGVDGARYRALEFGGETIRQLPMPERLTMCNMAIEAGAKNGIVGPDRLTRNYLRGRSRRTPRWFQNDPDASFIDTREYDCRTIDPLVARPHLPSNVISVYAFKRTEIDQVVIGSCTNGWFEDLRIAARLLAGRRVSRRVRLLVIPGTHDIYCRALRSGLIRCLVDAGAIIAPASCGPCLGGHLGVLARGERCVATTNRNFLGRMGHPESEVYLANPAVAAASAVLGRIAGPDELNRRGEK